MSAPILEMKDLDVFYGPIQALKKKSRCTSTKAKPSA